GCILRPALPCHALLLWRRAHPALHSFPTRRSSDLFTTLETAELVMPRLIKQDGSRQPFDEDKLRAGMQRALEKRPVSVERLEAAIAHIKHRLRATGEREVKALMVGELGMDELRKLDEIAYIRIASGYRRFQYLNEFREEIERLSREPSRS